MTIGARRSTRWSTSGRWAILLVLCLSLVMVVVGNTALNVALPTLVRELHASETQLQWITDAYSLVFAGLLLPAGALGDRFGRKGALQLGLTVVGIGCLLSTFANSADQLIATRALMGAGAAFVMPATLSILANVFPPAERPRAIGIWAGFAGAGGALGPIVSGLLLDHFWWGSVFFVNVPVVIVALISGAILLPTSRDPGHVRLDPVGAAAVDRGPGRAALRHHRGAGQGMGLDLDHRRVRGLRRRRGRLRGLGAAAPTTRCCRCRSSRTGASASAPAPSRSTSSACSACSSCSPSTSSSCAATARSRPGWPRCRWRSC